MSLTSAEQNEAGVPQQDASGAAADAIPRFGAATPFVVIAGVFAVSFVTWWAFGDPEWSFIDSSQAAVGAVLFWTILGTVFTAFTFGSWPFGRLGQPLGGLLQILFDIVFAFFAVWLFTSVIGGWDPTFSQQAPGGSGYTASAFVVLIGFYAFSFAAAGIGGYPFEESPGPIASFAQWLLAAFLTVIGVVWLIYPSFNPDLVAQAPVDLNVALGWVYSSIVVLLLAAQLWDNWPWASIENRHLRAFAAFVVTLGGGFLLYLLLAAVTEALVPAKIQDLPTFSSSAEAAQLGVNISLWCLIWGLLGLGPTRYAPPVNRLIKTLIVLVLSVALYLAIMHFVGTRWLHFPEMVPGDSYGGNPLTWTDWVIAVLLMYVVVLEGYGSNRARASGRGARV